ncbi:MAG: RNA polymerase sigma factor [Nitrososphaerales archaeon]
MPHRGCDDPVESAYRRHHGEVYRYLLRRTHDHFDAEDLTQAVYLEAARTLRSTRPRSVLAWLYAVAQRRFIDEVRRRNRQPGTIEVTDERCQEDSRLEYGPQTVRALSEALDRLSADDRALIVMKLLEGRTFDEIAERFGVSQGAAKMRFARALERLRDDLSSQGHAP